MRRIWSVPTLLGLAVLVACGGSASLIGVVKEPAGPVEAAEVLILSASGSDVVQRAITGSGGKFAINGALPSGAYVCEVRHKGYQTLKQSFAYPESASLELTLRPQITVKGVVHMPNDSVASGATIVFRQPGTDNKLQVTADEAGAYSVEGVDPGDWTVQVWSADKSKSLTDKRQVGSDQKVVQMDLKLSDTKVEAEATEGPAKAKVTVGVEAPVKN
jgi:Carboxypeptidase regulatory-like domain